MISVPSDCMVEYIILMRDMHPLYLFWTLMDMISSWRLWKGSGLAMTMDISFNEHLNFPFGSWRERGGGISLAVIRDMIVIDT